MKTIDDIALAAAKEIYKDIRWGDHRTQTIAQIQVAITNAIHEAAAPQVDRETARRIFDAGFIACRAYNDNHHHYRGEQAERVFMAHMDKLGIIFPAPPKPPRYVPKVGEWFWWRAKGDSTWRGVEHCCQIMPGEIRVHWKQFKIDDYEFAPAAPPEEAWPPTT